MPKRKKQRQPVTRPRIKKGDKVVLLAGKDRGQTGEVLKVIPEQGRALVQGVNRHTKPTEKDPRGGRVRKEVPVHLSNLKLIGPDGAPTKVTIRRDTDDEGNTTRVRVARTSGDVID